MGFWENSLWAFKNPFNWVSSWTCLIFIDNQHFRNLLQFHIFHFFDKNVFQQTYRKTPQSETLLLSIFYNFIQIEKLWNCELKSLVWITSLFLNTYINTIYWHYRNYCWIHRKYSPQIPQYSANFCSYSAKLNRNPAVCKNCNIVTIRPISILELFS